MGDRHWGGAALVVATLSWALIGAGSPAHADSTPPPGSDAEAADAEPGPYAPPPPAPTPSLVGSSVEVTCVRDVPVISYRVVLTDPAGSATDRTAILVITDGVNRVELPLGEVTSGELSGTTLWPGASVDANGDGDGWPGWVYRNGAWVETDENFGWTREAITATIEVNPQLPVPLAYPPATSACASPTVTGAPLSSGGSPLAATGGDAAAVAVVSGVGAAAVLLGGAALLARRRRV